MSRLCVGIAVSAEILLLITLSCARTLQANWREPNAPLLRYVDSMRTHWHRAARIYPPDPARYGLMGENKCCNVGGIIGEESLPRVSLERNNTPFGEMKYL